MFLHIKYQIIDRLLEMKMKITQSFVAKAAIPTDKDQIFYRDAFIKGFALRVTANGTKSFVVEKLINGKVRRLTIGKYGALTVDSARKEAQKLMGKIAGGSDPISEKKATRIKSATLQQVFDDYLKVRTLKEKTLYDYKRIIAIAFEEWQSKALSSITKEQVAKHHKSLGSEYGEAYANLSMRLLRALFNFAAIQYEDSQGKSLISENPTKRLTQTRSWYRIDRRQTYIKEHQLKSWYQASKLLENETVRDYFLLILFTGLRREEAAPLRWDQIDLKAKMLIIPDTKNHTDHTLPIPTPLYFLLCKRKKNSTSLYVFPGNGLDGYLVESRRQKEKIIRFSNIKFTIHDLRRTFITLAESLDISMYALKRLLNHKMQSDTTASYIITDVERLRKPMRLIARSIIKAIRLNKKEKIMWQEWHLQQQKIIQAEKEINKEDGKQKAKLKRLSTRSAN